jgi:hypothetical protein
MRSVAATKRLICGAAFLSAMGWASEAHAQLAVGTWVRTDAQANGLTMTVETCCNGGLRLIYHVQVARGQPPMTMTVDSPMDGTEVPTLVGGQPSGQTMAVKRIDASHYSGVVKVRGQLSATSNATISADGKTLTVETVSHGVPGAKAEKIIETWVRK